MTRGRHSTGTTALVAFALSAATGCSVPVGSRLAVVLSPDDVRVVVATCGERVDGVHAWFGTGEREVVVGEWEARGSLDDVQEWSMTSEFPDGSWRVVQRLDIPSTGTPRITFGGFTADNSNATDAIDVPLELLGGERRSTVLLETSSDGTIHESRLDPQRWAQRACDDV